MGCPRCGRAGDVSTPIARTCREIAHIVFDRLHDGETAEQILHPLELIFECDQTQSLAIRATAPLRRLQRPE